MKPDFSNFDENSAWPYLLDEVGRRGFCARTHVGRHGECGQKAGCDSGMGRSNWRATQACSATHVARLTHPCAYSCAYCCNVLQFVEHMREKRAVGTST